MIDGPIRSNPSFAPSFALEWCTLIFKKNTKKKTESLARYCAYKKEKKLFHVWTIHQQNKIIIVIIIIFFCKTTKLDHCIVELCLLNDYMRGREKNGQCCYNGEEGENKETNAIYHHGGKLPVSNKIVLVFFLFQFCSNES